MIMLKSEKIINLIQKIVVLLICFLLLFIMLYLCLASLITTTDMNMNNAMLENVEYRYDNFLLNILSLLIGIIVIYLLNKFIPPIKPYIIYICLFVLVSSFGIAFIISSQSAPTHDSLIVTRAAYYAAQNDFSQINTDYFRHFPFQLGYVLYSEILIRVFCPIENYLALEIINVIFLAGAYVAISETSKDLFGRANMLITSILLLACLPPIFFCSFLYGNIPGLSFAMLSILFVVKFLKTDKWYFGLLSAISIGVSVALKLNYVIILIAILITVIFHFISKRKIIKLFYILFAVLFVITLKQIPVKIYEERANIEFGNGVPMLSWAAMGMNESFIAPGWFDARHTTVNYDQNNMNAEDATKSSLEEIKTRLKLFSEDKAYRNDFFAKKALSQFNEPTYQSIWTNQVRGRYNDMGDLATYVCVEGETQVKQFMNLYQQFVFVGVSLALIELIRKKDILLCIYPLSILGGMIYHMIFEAKSQYFIVYFVMMVPLAAFGFLALCEKADRFIKIEKLKFKKSNKEKPLSS